MCRFRYNRAVVFDSEFFHATTQMKFASGHTNRRINFTFLFGTSFITDNSPAQAAYVVEPSHPAMEAKPVSEQPSDKPKGDSAAPRSGNPKKHASSTSPLRSGLETEDLDL